MLSNSELKLKTKEQLRGNWLKMVGFNLLIFFVMGILTGAFTFFTDLEDGGGGFLQLVLTLVGFIVTIGYVKMFLIFVKTNNLNFKNFIANKRTYFRGIIANLMLTIISGIIMFIGIFASIMIMVFTGAFSSIFLISRGKSIDESLNNLDSGSFIPVAISFFAIIVLMTVILTIVSLILSQTIYFVCIDRDDIGVFESLKESTKLMKGKKWQLFKIQLCIFGWSILTIFTLGIGILWLQTYSYTLYSNFFVSCIEESEGKELDLSNIDDNYNNKQTNEYKTEKSNTLEKDSEVINDFKEL